MTNNKLIIGISSRALFNLEKENEIYEQQGIEQYIQYQLNHENEILKPGVAFNLVRKLLSLNERKELEDNNLSIEVILMSRSCPDISIRIFNSIEYYKLPITRGIFTGGKPLAPYVKANGVDLYLSANEEDVRQVLNNNIAAGRVFTNSTNTYDLEDKEVRIAFDFDCVLANDEAENIYQSYGLQAFSDNEQIKSNIPMGAGPFKEFAVKLGKIQSLFNYDNTLIRIAICTARNYPAHKRTIKTLRSWGIRVNEVYFLGGYSKAKALSAFNADIFFDDSLKNIESTSQVVPSVQVL